MIRVAVEILTGTLFYVEVEADAALSDLKKAIGFQEQLPPDRLILVTGHGSEKAVMCEDDVALREYGVGDGSHVYLFFETMEDEEGENCHFGDFFWCHSSKVDEVLTSREKL